MWYHDISDTCLLFFEPGHRVKESWWYDSTDHMNHRICPCGTMVGKTSTGQPLTASSSLLAGRLDQTGSASDAGANCGPPFIGCALAQKSKPGLAGHSELKKTGLTRQSYQPQLLCISTTCLQHCFDRRVLQAHLQRQASHTSNWHGSAGSSALRCLARTAARTKRKQFLTATFRVRKVIRWSSVRRSGCIQIQSWSNEMVRQTPVGSPQRRPRSSQKSPIQLWLGMVSARTA